MYEMLVNYIMITTDLSALSAQVTNPPVWLTVCILTGVAVGGYLLWKYNKTVDPRRTDGLWGIGLIGVGVILTCSFLFPNTIWGTIAPLVSLLSVIGGTGKLIWDTANRLIRKIDQRRQDFVTVFALLLMGLAYVLWFLGQFGSAFK